MNWISFVLSIAAALAFLAAFGLVPSKRPLIALGLLLLTAAWTLALVWPRATVVIH